MTFAVPPITTVEVAAVLLSKKFHIENWSKLTGVAQTSYYATLEEATLEEIAVIIIKQVNDETAGKECSVRITVDGEVFVAGGQSLTNNATYYVWMLVPTALGTNALMTTSTTNLTRFGWQSFEIAAATDRYALGSAGGGHEVKIEMQIDDVPGTNQKLYMDIYYFKNEAV